MELQILMPHHELMGFLDAAMPVVVNLEQGAASSRWIRLREPRELVFDEEEALIRLTLTGDVRWPVPLWSDDHKITSINAKLRPSIQKVAEGARLVFDLELDSLDVAMVPQVIDQLIVQRINAQLAAQRTRFAWNYSEDLALNLGLPEWFQAGDLDVLAQAGAIVVRCDAIVIKLHFEINIGDGEERGATPSFATEIGDSERKERGFVDDEGGRPRVVVEGNAEPASADALPPTRLV